MDDSVQIIEDYSRDEDDDEVIIIDNPHPKSPAPVVILFDSDDDDNGDNDDCGGGKTLTKEIEPKNSSDNPQKTTLDTSKESCLEIISSDDSDIDGSCIRINDPLMNDKNNAMKEWYKKYKSSSSVNLTQSPYYYVCPECLAALPSVFMIDKHILARHPKSVHRFHKDNNKGYILHVLSDSERSSPIKHTESSRCNFLTKDCEVATSSETNKHSGAVQRLKLTPLQSPGKRPLNCDNPSNKTTNSELYIPLNLPPLPTIYSQDEFCTTNIKGIKKSTGLLPLKNDRSETVIDFKNFRTSEPPMARIKPLVLTLSSNTSSVSSECPETRKPLTVVLFSPNDSSTSERKVQVSPRDSNSKTQECLEVISTGHNSELEDSVQENSIEDIRTQRVVEFNLKKTEKVPLKKGFKKALTKKINSRISVRKNIRTRNLKRGKNIKVDKNSNSDRCKDKLFSKDEFTDVGTTLSKEVETKTSEKIANKKRKRDPLLILTEGDSTEKSLPEKQLKDDDCKSHDKDVPKRFLCEHCNKRFTTVKDKANHIRDKHLRPKPGKALVTRRPPPLYISTDPPAIDKLSRMKHIVMIDVDNWKKIFESDLKFSPSTFVWAFHGGTTMWWPPVSSALLRHLRELDCFYLHPRCGKSKDAADFALCVQAGKLDVQLPKTIPFTVLSGDKGFRELQNQLNLSKREVHIVNPHHKTLDTVLTILNSIADK